MRTQPTLQEHPSSLILLHVQMILPSKKAVVVCASCVAVVNHIPQRKNDEKKVNENRIVFQNKAKKGNLLIPSWEPPLWKKERPSFQPTVVPVRPVATREEPAGAGVPQDLLEETCSTSCPVEGLPPPHENDDDQGGKTWP